MIHPTAIISPNATVAEGVHIGAYTIIGDGVTVGAGCKFHSHVVVESNTTIGEGNEFYPFASIGARTQDLKYEGEPTSLVIGDRNVFRESVTIHRSTSKTVPTKIGNDNNFLAYAHVAHDCEVGDHCIFSNNGTIAGHVVVGDYAIISGLAGVHQFCRIGRHSIIGGCSKIVQDVPPFTIADGSPAELRGVNLVGMKRRGFNKEEVREVKNAYKAFFLDKEQNMQTPLENKAEATGLIAEIRDFIIAAEGRGVTR